MAQKSRCSIRDFASMIGSLISVCPAVQYGLLYTKKFEREKFLALVRCNEDFSAFMEIPSHLQSDFTWWINVLSNPDQSNRIRSGRFVREIFSDASLNGWGAACGESRTHGWWSGEHRSLHINSLELRAALYVGGGRIGRIQEAVVGWRGERRRGASCEGAATSAEIRWRRNIYGERRYRPLL